MGRALAERRDEVGAKLAESHDARACGEFAAFEPLRVLLAQERERFKASRA